MIIISIALLHEKRKIRVNALRERIDLMIDNTFTILQKFVKFHN